MPNIICQSCQFENDPSRVFCQNCGIRLERPAGMAFQGPSKSGMPEKKETAPSPAKPKPISSHKAAATRPGVKKSRGGNPAGAIFAIIFALVRWAIYGAILAGVVLILMKPGDVEPPIPPGSIESAEVAAAPDGEEAATGQEPAAAVEQPAQGSPTGSSIADIAWGKVEAAAEAPYPRQASLSTPQVNAILSESLLLKPSGTARKIGWEYNGARFTPEQGTFVFSLVQSIVGKPIYFNGTFQPVSAGGGSNLELVGASIGRLEIPSFAVPLLEKVFQPAAYSLKTKLDLLRKADKVELQAEGVLLNFPGAGR